MAEDRPGANPYADQPGGAAVRDAKAALRVSVLGIARQVGPADRELASRAACGHLLDVRAMRLAHTIALYHAVGHELDPGPIHEALEARDARVLLPRMVAGAIMLWDAGDPGLLVAGPQGVPEPPAREDGGTVDLEEVGAIVVPGVAFDLHGGRLGRGGGHYDRLLAALPHDTLRIGLAHTVQLVASVPRAAHDEQLDVIATNLGLHHTGARTQRRDA